jgi:LemA protein
MRKFLIVIIIILLVFIATGIFYTRAYNKLVRYRETCNISWKKIETEFQKKSNLIPTFLTMMKDYTVQEKDIIQYTRDVHTNFMSAKTKKEKISTFYAVNNTLSKLLSIVDKYPELKANENFTPLMNKLKETENNIAKVSQKYSENVKRYNTLIKTFPTDIIAKSQNFSAYPEFPKEKNLEP